MEKWYIHRLGFATAKCYVQIVSGRKAWGSGTGPLTGGETRRGDWGRWTFLLLEIGGSMATFEY
jgi:hypothetical protein